MQHVDPDVLALLALGEDAASAAEHDHLATCEHCVHELADLSDVVATGRSVTLDDALVAPDPAVWSRISAELGLGSASTGVDAASRGFVAAVPDAATPEDEEPPLAATPVAPAPAPAPAPLTNLADRRRTASRRGPGWMLVAASAALVVGVAGGVLWERRNDAPAEAPIASATLVALPDWPDASGQARVKEVDGHRQVVVDLDAPASADGYREVWLIASDLSGLVSLGVLQGTEGRFDIPAGLDLAKFSLVDVSEEHLDGDPAHSGDSIVRGPLEPREA